MPFAAINVTGAGQTTIIAAIPNRRIRVVNYTVLVNADSTLKFQSVGGSSTDLTGPMPFGTNGGASPCGTGQTPSGQMGMFETLPGEALAINLGSAVTAAGHIAYTVQI